LIQISSEWAECF